MTISDDLRAVAKFGTPMLNGRSREDFLNAAADEIDRLRDFLAELSRDAEFAQRHSYAGELYASMKFASETRKKIRSVIESKEQG